MGGYGFKTILAKIQEFRKLSFCLCIVLMVLSIAFIQGCNSSDGANGSNGSDGVDGADGSDGSDSMPYVVYSSPVNGETGVKESGTITVVFNKEIDTTTATEGSGFRVIDSDDNDVTGSVSWDTGNRNLTFTPAALLGSRQVYRVRISGSVTDTDGNAMGYEYESSFTSIGWGITERAESDDTGSAIHPQIAFDSDGNAIAVWQQHDGTEYNTWANRYITGHGWSVAEMVEGNSGSVSRSQVAVAPDGDAIAVWRQYDGTRYNVWANRYQPDNGWGTAGLIESRDDSAQSPKISMDSNGNAMVVWEQSDGTMDSIYANRFNGVSGTWSGAELVETNDTDAASSPEVAMNPDGTAIVIWQHYNTGLTMNTIMANRYVQGTGWDGEELINTTTSSATAPDVSIDPGGNAIAVWAQDSNIRANRYVSGTGWGADGNIEQTTGNADNVTVSVGDSGNAIAVWRQFTSTRYNIWSNRYVAGVGWGDEELVETDDTGTVYPPEVSTGPEGNAIVIWYQDRGGINNIWSNRYISGTGWQTAQLIESDNSGSALYPQVSFDYSGNALAIWNQTEGGSTNIISRWFD